MSIWGNPVMLGGSGGGGHPASFIQYLESSGTQYIDTGLLADSDTDLSITFYVFDDNLEHDIFGARDGSNLNSYGLLEWVNYGVVDFGSVREEHTYTAETRPYNLDSKCCFEFINKKAYFNSNLAYTFNETFAANLYTQFLFAYNRAGVVTLYGKVRIYRATYSKNGVLLKDFVPAIDNNNVAGMWETVRGEMYYNAGTGTFITPT